MLLLLLCISCIPSFLITANLLTCTRFPSCVVMRSGREFLGANSLPHAPTIVTVAGLIARRCEAAQTTERNFEAMRDEMMDKEKDLQAALEMVLADKMGLKRQVDETATQLAAAQEHAAGVSQLKVLSNRTWVWVQRQPAQSVRFVQRGTVRGGQFEAHVHCSSVLL